MTENRNLRTLHFTVGRSSHYGKSVGAKEREIRYFRITYPEDKKEEDAMIIYGDKEKYTWLHRQRYGCIWEVKEGIKMFIIRQKDFLLLLTFNGCHIYYLFSLVAVRL